MAVDTVRQTLWTAFFQGNYVLETDLNCNIIRKVTAQNNPNWVAFDGNNIWVTNYGSNSVSKIDAATGTYLASYSVGAGPRGVIFDGTFIWVANQGSNTVTKINPSNGQIFGAYYAGVGPAFLAKNPADGTIWVPDRDGNTVTVLNPSTGSTIRTVPTDTQPQYITADGNGNMWVSCYNSKKVDKIQSDGLILGHFTPPQSGPTGLVYDPYDGLIWGVTWSGYLYSMDQLGTVTYSAWRGGSSHGHYAVLWFSGFPYGPNIWATDTGGGIVNKLLTNP